MKLLVVPDIHENLEFLKYIFAYEDTASFDHVVLLPFGGPLWLDWNREFEDALEVSQIVGHTRCVKQTQKGRSFCIDLAQAAYAVVENGEVQLNICPDSWLGESMLESV